MIMSWAKSISACFRKCCGEQNKENEALASESFPSFESTYTVRRISSFGQTILDEKGEEKEIERHTSVVTYDGNSAPWSSKPAPVQPGVTISDVKKQIKKMPPISEYPTRPKQKQKWKKSGISSKKDIAFSDLRKLKRESPENAQLKSAKYNAESNLETVESKKPEIYSSSHEDIFSKCQRRTATEENQNGNTLVVPGLTTKSVSTPDLVNGEPMEKKIRNLKATGQLSLSSDKKDLLNELPATNQKGKDLEAEKLAREHGLDLALYTEEALNESIKSVTCSNVQRWNEEPVGTLVLAIYFNTLQKMLTVNLISMLSLCGAGVENENFDAIIKVSVIGSKKYTKTSKKIEEKWRTAINQGFSFLVKDMDFRSLRIVVYNADWIGKHDAIGYGLLSLQNLLEKSENIHLKLYQQPNTESEIGMMQISFGYDGIVFSITVEKVFNYDIKIRNWKVYIKIAYYSLSKKVKERISNLAWDEKNTGELFFNLSAGFRMEPSAKKHSYVVITLKRGDNRGVFKSDQSLGRVILGPSYYYQDGKKLTPWGLALTNKKMYNYSFKIYG